MLLKVYGLIALLALALVPFFFLPAEDSIILFSYSRNLAEHGAITFLAHGPHVEGATDFAWMVLVAGGMRLGVSPLWFSAGVNVVSALLLAALLLKLAGVRLSLPRLLAVTGAIACVPQILAAAAGFAVLPDAVLLTALVLFVMRGRSGLASVAAFVFCLFRPDGVVFAVPLLASLFYLWPQRWKSASSIGGLFLLPGMLYFVWRWRYFDEFFPLPFLVKSDTHRALGIFVLRSVHQSWMFLLFALVLLAPVIFRRRALHLWLLLPLLALPTLFYWAMRLDQNVAARFFYYVPLAAAIVIAVNWEALRGRQSVVLRLGCLGWLLILAMPLFREVRTLRDGQFTEVKSIAEAFNRMPQHGTILTSEAGFLPYFSGWTTYDAWGLNTPEFAHHFFQREDVERLKPDLVVFHPDDAESCVALSSWSSGYTERRWPHMTRNLTLGANPTHYELWLTSYGSEFYRRRRHWRYGEGDRECWLVRIDSPLYPEITQVLREHNGVAPEESLVLERKRGGLQR
ncbi:hypothetical protein [Granulicella sp. dw_53]|uniref:hypothetical protein n=1 Tax=Granulicella sp. dw_53 TaxID=2719792 RepID=UPI001BD3570C|nr:hypothetical protein [Granulicella sp. dw_53]